MAIVYENKSSYLLRQIRHFQKGWEGEDAIRQALEHQLPTTFLVLKNLRSTKSGNIDFVVVGPTGIFSIEVKNWTGKITLKGEKILQNGYVVEKNCIKQVKGQAHEIHKILSRTINGVPFVQPILAFVNGSDLPAIIDGVAVTSLKNLPQYIQNCHFKYLNTHQAYAALHPYLNQQSLFTFAKSFLNIFGKNRVYRT